MKLVYQRQNGDCVVAAVATLAGRSWREVRVVAGSTRYGLDRTETRQLLDEFGCSHSYSSPRNRPTPGEWVARNLKSRAILIIRYADSTQADHAMVAYDGILHDPARNPDADCYVTEVYRLLSGAKK